MRGCFLGLKNPGFGMNRIENNSLIVWRLVFDRKRENAPDAAIPERATGSIDKFQRNARRNGKHVEYRRHAVPDKLHTSRAVEHGDIFRKSTRLNSSHVEISYAVFC